MWASTETSLDKIPRPSIAQTPNLVKQEKSGEGIFVKLTEPNYEYADDEYLNIAVYIDGFGQIPLGKHVDGEFLYPFVEDKKTYKVRFVYNLIKYDEATDVGQFVKPIAWQETELTADGGKGEIIVKKAPTISMKSNGDYTITPPQFNSDFTDYDIFIATYNGNSNDVASCKHLNGTYIRNDELNNAHNIFGIDYHDNYGSINFIIFGVNTFYHDRNDEEWEYTLGGTHLQNVSVTKEIADAPLKLRSQFFNDTSLYSNILTHHYGENDYEYNLEFDIFHPQNHRRLKKGDQFTVEFSADYSNILRDDNTLGNLWVTIISPNPEWKTYSNEGGTAEIAPDENGQISFKATFTLDKDVSPLRV